VKKIEVKNLFKTFGKKQVLKGVDVSVEKGESLVIIGGSGSGKSVLLKSIVGLIEPDAGSIKIDGEETAHASSRKRDELMIKFGYLFQGGALFDSLKIWENVAFGLIRAKHMKTGKKLQKNLLK
jgi:phospholipid/cholesterol/gamma-HCH transport system ATP-binding protein